jgi:hypothetical protein
MSAVPAPVRRAVVLAASLAVGGSLYAAGQARRRALPQPGSIMVG